MGRAATVELSAAASRAAQRGRVWFFTDDLARAVAEHGDLVEVRGDRGARLGLGWFADERARIRLRLCLGSAREASSPEEFLRARIRGSIERRGPLRGPLAGVRLVHAEADGVPGLVVDAYADVAVVQLSAAALEVHRATVVDELVRSLAPRAIVARNDIRVRELEGLGGEVELLHGERVAEVEIEEHGVMHTVRPFDGHKTGFYLDQRDARRRVQELADGRTVLDLFAYQGGFSLAALRGGARSALAVDQSATALERAIHGAERNGLAGLETLAANAFDALREVRASGRTFDLVILDPPPFAKSKRELAGGKRGYRDLNRLAMRALAPGGLLLTCSCSHHVTPPMFEDLVRQAAGGSNLHVVLRERLMAGADHPAAVKLPESEYLKSCLLERIELDR